MKRAIFFVLLFTSELVLISQNLVVNPGFEIWEKVTKPTGWTTAQNCLKDSVNINSGNYSCRHAGSTATKYLGQNITVIPGNGYRLSFYYKTEITGNGNGCRIWCYWKDAEWNNISDPASDVILRPAKYLQSDIWALYTIDIIAPVTAFNLYLEVRIYPNSVVYWDDFVFEENMATYDPEVNRSEITIYPNPVSEFIIIRNVQDLRRIDIQYLTGSIIRSSTFDGEGTVTIPVPGLPDGLYIIRIYSSGKIITRKFIKN